MQQQPSVIAAGDFLYFAPAGKAFTVPQAGVVSASAKPDKTDAIWTTYALGTVADGKPTKDKYTGKPVVLKSPMPGTGIIAASTILRPEFGLEMEVTMNEQSRLALAGFYKTPIIETGDAAFYPGSRAASLSGWLKRQRYDAANGLDRTSDWWVDLDCEEFVEKEGNIIQPKFKFTWLYSALPGDAI